MDHLRQFLFLPIFLLLALSGAAALADDEEAWSPAPPRLSYIDGPVSYWRPGAEDWASARLNLPLAEGDALYTGQHANLELQFGNRSFVRADEDTQLSLENQEERFIQFKVTDGLVSFDIRSIAQGETVEVDTPNAVFTIEHPGYYRVDVDGRDTHFITQHGGRAIVTTADGRSMSIYPSEDIVVSGNNPTQVATYAAPVPDAWDRWNEERTSRMTESVSTRYLPPDVYGAEDLDNYGQWRIVHEFGPVWIPYGMARDWVPYSTGSWVWDPYYEWTWIDDAPWGWAPFHYGRWVDIGGLWAWAPGPVVRRSVYCPALVSFLVRGRDISLRVGVGVAGLSWVALSWGEPVLPWWGRRELRGHPHWAGWGGPRVVNNVVVNNTTVINVNDIHYRNASLPRAILTAPADKFGRERFRATAVTDFRHEDFTAVRGELPVKPTQASLLGGAPKGLRPPRDIITRPVVASHPPRERALPWHNAGPVGSPEAGPAPHVVKPPSRGDQEINTPPRPPFGPQAGPERRPLPLPPRFGESRSAMPPPASPRSLDTGPSREAPRSPSTSRSLDTGRGPDSGPKVERVPARPAQVAPPPAPRLGHEGPPSQQGREDRAVSPAREEGRREGNVQALPGTPANQTYPRGTGEKRRWNRDEERGNP